jgi:hypothetical protein
MSVPTFRDPSRSVVVFRRALVGASIAIALMAVLELVARAVEARLPNARPFDFATVRNAMVVDPTTGEASPSVFEPAGGGFGIRAIYTAGDRCYPFHCQAIPAQKADAEFRIACFGGSTTAGLDLLRRPANCGHDARRGPWPGAEPFCLLLRRELQERMPDRLVTAYNLGGDAFDSEKVLPVVREASRRLRFDLWVVYMGHNEFLFAPDLVQVRTRFSALSRLGGLAEGHLALYRLMARLCPPRAPGGVQGRVREFSREIYVRSPTHSEAIRQVGARYEARLREIVALARHSGARLVFSELVSNHAWDGAAGDVLFACHAHRSSDDTIARITHEQERADRLLRSGSVTQALEAYRSIETLDPGYQPALVGEVRSLLALGRRAEALETSYRAQALAALPVVVTAALTEGLRRVAAETGTSLAATITPFDQIFLKEPARYSRLFLDDCHPSAEGHRMIAERIVAALERTGAIPPRAHLKRGPDPSDRQLGSAQAMPSGGSAGSLRE